MAMEGKRRQCHCHHRHRQRPLTLHRTDRYVLWLFYIVPPILINLMVSTYRMLSLNYFVTLIGHASDFPALAMLMRYRLRRTQKLWALFQHYIVFIYLYIYMLCIFIFICVQQMHCPMSSALAEFYELLVIEDVNLYKYD